MGTGTGTRRLWVILMIGSLFWHDKVSTRTHPLTTTDREAYNKTLRWGQGKVEVWCEPVYDTINSTTRKWTCVWGESDAFALQ
jgi:hypothetical protein